MQHNDTSTIDCEVSRSNIARTTVKSRWNNRVNAAPTTHLFNTDFCIKLIIRAV